MIKYINDPKDLPESFKWLVIEFSSIYIPGDERSRTNPGHGYPATTERVCHLIAFDSEQEWKDEIARKHLRNKKFLAFTDCAQPKIRTEVKVEYA